MHSYRPDIDGLRAIAVLAVLAFHASDSRLPGGFVGVDVFFVISGYLISGILLRDHAAGRARFSTFYARRVRRIFPALMVVLAASLLAGWFLLFDFELEQLGKHVAAGVAFVSNVALFRESGYFDTEAELKPLLHLWSLGIEEQFYLAWPPLLWLACRLKRPMAAACALALASFGANLAAMAADPNAAFFLPHARAWELLAGALLAIRESAAVAPSGDAAPRNPDAASAPAWRATFRRLAGSRFLPHLMSAAGCLLVFVAIACFDERLPFPGWWALVPTLGTVIVIAAGPGAWVNRNLLARRAMVYVGQISYPLYLWHWPLLYLVRIATVGNPSRSLRLGALVAAFALSALTYRWLERPVRAAGSRTAVAVLVVTSVALGAVGLSFWRSIGPPPRLGAMSFDLTDLRPWGEETRRTDDCARALRFPTHFCTISPAKSEPVVALIGDSHANHLGPGLDELLARDGRPLVQLGSNGCPPTWGAPSANRDVARCRSFVEPALEFALASPRIETVLLAAAWGNRLKSLGDAALSADLDRTLGRLAGAGKRVVFVHDTPDLEFDPRSCFNALRLARGPVEIVCRTGRARAEALQSRYRRVLGDVLARHREVAVFDPLPSLCDAGACYGIRAGTILYRDHDHLSVSGSRALAAALRSALGPL